MRFTGVVRRMDDLGRIVIPKEIRKILDLKEGDALEFYVNEGNKSLTLQRYQPTREEQIEQYFEELKDIIARDNTETARAIAQQIIYKLEDKVGEILENQEEEEE